MAILWLRAELYEHGVLLYPSRKSKALTLESISSLINYLRQKNPVAVTDKVWTEAASKYLSWTSCEIQTFWELLLYFSQDMTPVVEASGYMVEDGALLLAFLAQFLFAHLDTSYRRKETIESLNAVWHDESPHPRLTTLQAMDISHSPSSHASHASPTHTQNSPRTVGLLLRTTADQNRITFLKSNLMALLELVAGKGGATEKTTETRLEKRHLDLLSFLLEGGTAMDRKCRLLSELMPGWVDEEGQTTRPAEEVADWIRKHVTVNEISHPAVEPYQQGIIKSPPISEGPAGGNALPKTLGNEAPLVRTIVISNQVKSTLVKTAEKELATLSSSGSSLPSLDLVIAFCEDSYIYVLLPLRCVSVIACRNCTIVVGASSAIVTVDRCEKVQLTVAARHLHLSNCLDSTFSVFTTTAPVMFGDNHGIRFGPHNTYYPTLEAHLTRAGLAPSDGQHPWGVFEAFRNIAPAEDDDEEVVRLEAPQDYQALVVPCVFDSAATLRTTAFPLPPAYQAVIDQRQEAMAELRQLISNTNLDMETQHSLQGAIHASFKEWLNTSGNSRQILDLIHQERRLRLSSVDST